jgi:hypothetical protein
VPANGYLSGRPYGQGWECEHGYQEVKSSCVAVALPENTHMDFSGSGWDCNKPYRKQQNSCVSGDRNE